MSRIPIEDGELELIGEFIPADEATDFLARLGSELNWREETLTIAGRSIPVPRLVCWYGDPGARYRYSGVDHEPLPWPELVLGLRQRVEDRCGRRFNSVLGNLYRDGRETMGWHADKEKELGPAPFIASLSFGTERRFELRHNRSREWLRLDLGSGSLLLMGGCLQHHWRHRVPRMPGVLGPRVNLTFRCISPSP